MQGIRWAGVILQRADGTLEGWEITDPNVHIGGSMMVDMFTREISGKNVTITVKGTAYRSHKAPKPPDITPLAVERGDVIDAVIESEVSGDGDSSETSGEVED